MRGKTREDAVLLMLSLKEQVNILVQYRREGESGFLRKSLDFEHQSLMDIPIHFVEK